MCTARGARGGAAMPSATGCVYVSSPVRGCEGGLYPLMPQSEVCLPCDFLLMDMLSRLRTVSSVCELSRIFRYAASVSWIVLS
jgi:hypothetical protein